MARVGEAFVDIKPNLDGFDKALSKGVGDSVQKAGQNISKAGSTLTKSVTLPLVGIGTTAFGAATTVEKAMRDIRVRTGATGDTLAQLQRDFDVVATTSAGSIGRVGTVISDLNTRLGLTGKPMQDLAGQVLNLEAILGGTEVSLDTLTRVFGAFQVQPEEYAGTLDKLFRASQATGVEFNTLQGLLVSQSAAFGELGFGIDETVAILGQFEKAGVNTETVLAGLRANIVKAAGEGKSAAEFFRDGVKTIEQFILEGDEAAAQAAARELFGARTFLDALDAIKRGQFNIDETVSQIQNGADTIDGLADETLGFSAEFQRFRNQMTLSIAPLGEKLMPLLTRAIETVVPFIINLIDSFNNLSPSVQAAIGVVAGVLVVLGPVLVVVGKVVAIVGKLAGAFAFFVSPVGLVVLAIGAVIAIIVLVIKHFDKIKEALSAVAGAIGDFISGAIEFIKNAFNAVWETVQNVWDSIVGFVGNALSALWNLYLHYLNLIWDTVKAVFGAIRDTIVGVIKAVVGFVTDSLSFMWQMFRRYLRLIWDTVTTVFDAIRNTITAVVDAIKTVITVTLQAIRDTFVRIFTAIRDTIATILETIRDIFVTAFETIRNAVTTAFDKIRDAVGAVMSFIKDTILNGLRVVKDLFVDTFNGIVDFFGGAVSRLARVGADIFGFIRESFKAALNFVIRGWNRLRFSIPGFNVGPVRFGGFTLGVPQIPELANGGIVRSAMLATIGEAGAEAVIPLSRPARAMQLMEQSGLADMVRQSSSTVTIQTANFMNGTDADLVAQKVLAAWRGRTAA